MYVRYLVVIIRFTNIPVLVVIIRITDTPVLLFIMCSNQITMFLNTLFHFICALNLANVNCEKLI